MTAVRRHGGVRGATSRPVTTWIAASDPMSKI
jgi:hypothetical protein